MKRSLGLSLTIACAALALFILGAPGCSIDLDGTGPIPDKDAALVDVTNGDGASGGDAALTCIDHALDGDETDVDCGGSCPDKCAGGQQCRAGTDCKDNVCVSGQCAPRTCSDGTTNGRETDVDCGGGQCNPCAVGKVCSKGADCASLVCGANKTCSAPACNDGVRNGAETDVDCGGGCPACADGKRCAAQADCGSASFCNAAQACAPKLGLGGACSQAFMCTSGNCVDGVCCDTPSASCKGCRQCNAAGNLGHCTNVPVNQDPHLACTAGPCTRASCAGDGTCNLPDNTVCSVSTCAGGIETDHACVAGSCGNANKGCGAYACNGATCGTSCASDAGCANGFYCSKAGGGTCVAILGLGASCNPAADCQQSPCRECPAGGGGCVDGFCCNTACAGACDVCNATPGTCTVLAPGSTGSPSCSPYVCSGAATCPLTCSSNAQCIAGDYCDVTNHCAPKIANGSPCTAGPQCVSGNCVQGQTGLVCSQVASCPTCEVTNGTSCVGATAGSDPKSECVGACATGCDGVGACAFRANSFMCSAALCNNGQITSAFCTGSSAACPAPTTVECPGKLKCASGSTCRLPPCITDQDCQTGTCGGGGVGLCGP